MKQNNKSDRRQERADKKISKAMSKSPKKGMRAQKKYGYDYKAAVKAGISPDETGHWDSRDPETGRILKGKKHPTIRETKKAERKLGYKVYRKDGSLYSKPKKK